jgi:carbon monoxide dehydrogenase subunit G
MKVTGRATLDAPRDAVFAAICDPASLLAVIPGCEAIERVSDDEYRGRIALRLPAIVGTFDTLVRFVSATPPERGDLAGRVEGRVGWVSGTASFRLADSDGGTTIAYEGEAEVGGPIARLDSRFLEGLARSLVDQGLARLGARLAAAEERLTSGDEELASAGRGRPQGVGRDGA